MQEQASFTALYNQHRDKFVRWAKSWTDLAEHDIVDVYQDACVIYWQKAESGTFVLTSRPGTFLFGIGRNLLREKLRSRKKEPAALPDGMQISDAELNQVMAGPDQELIEREHDECLSRVLDMLGEGCATILKLTYYEEKNSQEVAEASGYASGDVVRQMKRRCLSQLRELYKKHCML